MILAGDIGGTHSRLALFSEEAGRLRLAREKIYLSREHKGLDEIISLFLQNEAANIKTACFGIAGPVMHGQAKASNLAWGANSRQLARQTGIRTVWVINDLEAHAYGIDDLKATDLTNLNSAKPSEGNAALIAAGTGLGEAGMYWDGTRRYAFAGEGGHSGFAPRNDLELSLHQYLMNKFGYVSCEHVLSGPGLKNVYDFLRDSGTEPEPAWLKDELRQASDPVPVISRHGLEAKAPICERTLDIFVGAYGAEAGNLALKLLATGGVFISGGIAIKILPKLHSPEFLQAFYIKGPMKALLEAIPITVITNESVGLFGAARYALTKATANPSTVVTS
jgi:glucokinase